VNQTGKSILLVDDDQDIRELLQTYLSRSGFRVRTVPDGTNFREALTGDPADLVILDVMLPDEDGFSLCSWVRGHQKLAQMPIIMLTASSDETDRIIGLDGRGSSTGTGGHVGRVTRWPQRLITRERMPR